MLVLYINGTTHACVSIPRYVPVNDGLMPAKRLTNARSLLANTLTTFDHESLRGFTANVLDSHRGATAKP